MILDVCPPPPHACGEPDDGECSANLACLLSVGRRPSCPAAPSLSLCGSSGKGAGQGFRVRQGEGSSGRSHKCE